MRRSILAPAIVAGAMVVLLLAALLNWLLPTLGVLDALTGNGPGGLPAEFFLVVIPVLLSWAIHLRVHQLKLPAHYGLLALAPVIVASGIALLDVQAQEAALEGCFTAWCDQQPMVVELDRVLVFLQYSLNALAVAAIGGLYWAAGRRRRNRA